MDLVVFTSARGSRASVAAAFFNALVTPSLAVAVPAVPDPSANGRVDADFLAVVKELGSRFTVVPPSRFTCELGAKAALIVYVGCAANTLRVDGVPFLEWDVAPTNVDPKDSARVVRDSILRSVEDLLRRRGWMRQERTRNGR